MPFSKARQIAEVWVAVMTDGCAEIVREAVQAKPYGWIFYYQSSAFLHDKSKFSEALVGNAPFIVDRINGEIRVLGTGGLLEQRLSEYERSLPAACLLAKPEAARW
ncbi:MAG: hypothetical protein EPO18_06710 [Methylobacter sp.]|nr:MAG: hypothetical protein EPO18_06710 [Methylobacter sp.]